MFRRAAALLIFLVLVGCQQATETVELPTAANLDAISTDRAATSMAIASPTRRPLPPTFTPLPSITPLPTDPASVPTPTPEGFRAAGTLYYIFNDDAIVELAADGSFEDLLPISQIGQQISGLALSPDDRWLAFVAPGAGSAREVFVTDRKGGNTHQLSQLGFSEVERPVWSPDSRSLAFIAAQQPGAPRGIYMAFADGSGQRTLLQMPTTELRDLAWNEDGSRLFFSDHVIFSLDIATQRVSNPLTEFGGFGPDFSLAHSPVEPTLWYLKPYTDLSTGQRGGLLYFMDTQNVDKTDELPGAKLYVNSLTYSRDGDYLLIADDTRVWVQVQVLQTASMILQDLPLPPRPVFSPDAGQVAYISQDDLGMQQIYKIDRSGGNSTQVTFHQEGTISEMVWAAG